MPNRPAILVLVGLCVLLWALARACAVPPAESAVGARVYVPIAQQGAPRCNRWRGDDWMPCVLATLTAEARVSRTPRPTSTPTRASATSDVFPLFSSHNTANSRFVHPVSCGLLPGRHPGGGGGKNDGDIRFAKLGAPVLLAASQPFRVSACMVLISTGQPFGASARSVAVSASQSSFLGRVPLVLCIRAKKKALRIATRGIVAVMANEQLIGYRPILYYPRHAVCPAVTTTNRNCAVSSLSYSTCPRPTRIRPAAPVNPGVEPSSVSGGHHQNGAVSFGQAIIARKHPNPHSGGARRVSSTAALSCVEANYSIIINSGETPRAVT